MTGFVVDASVAASWLFEDEASPETDNLLRRVPTETAVVPELWYLEIGNMIATAERRGRVRASEISGRLAIISLLPFRIEPVSADQVLSAVLSLARSEKLTTYDAIYLHLAVNLGMPLATRDASLVRAARKHYVTVLP